MQDHTVRCWGQIGNGSPTPTVVEGLTDVAEIRAGAQYACARRSDGTVWCWGSGAKGQLGDGAATSSDAPVQVAGVTTAIRIACGTAHACAILSTTGEVYCWGANGLAQLGTGPGADYSPTPIHTPVVGATSISAGALNTCIVVQGDVQCWGAVVDKVFYGATPVPNGSGFSELAPTAASHHCGILSDSRVACWGANTIGQLGSTSPASSDEPLVVVGLSQVSEVSVGTSALEGKAVRLVKLSVHAPEQGPALADQAPSAEWTAFFDEREIEILYPNET